MAAPTPVELLQPEGPLTPDLYPDDAPPPAVGAGTVLGRLQRYIDRAVAHTATFVNVVDPDAAAKAYALYLACNDAYIIRSSKPATENLSAMGLKATTYSKEQLGALKGLASDYLGQFSGLVGLAGVSSTDLEGTTTSVPTRITY